MIIGPSNIDAEQAVIGSVLMNNKNYYAVKSILDADYFMEPIHKNIWKLASEMIEAKKTASPITLKTYLQEKITNDMTIQQYLARLAAAAEPHFIVNYASIIREMYIRRYAISDAEFIIKDCLEPQHDISMQEVIGKWSTAIARLSQLLEGGTQSSTLHDEMVGQVDMVAEAFSANDLKGYDVGIRAVSDLTGRWLHGQFIIIGAATKVGKSALAMQTAVKIAEVDPVLYFSYEMNGKFLAGRKLASMTKIPTSRQRSGSINEKEYEKLDLASKQNEQATKNLHIVSDKLNIVELKQYVREFKLRHPKLGAVYVDHLGILGKSKNSKTNKDWEIAAEAAPELKALADELGILVVGISQLNKDDGLWGLRTMKSKIQAALRRPNAGELKGAIANDADHVIMPFRPQMLLEKFKPPKSDVETEDSLTWGTAYDEWKNRAQIVLTLSRESSFPRYRDCAWDGPRTEFLDFDHEPNSNRMI